MAMDDAQASVDAHLGRVLAQFPDEVRHALRDQFVAAWLEPMTAELELVLRKRLTDDEVRHLLFAPTPAQYRHYATLLSIESSASAPWLQRLHKRFLALFCLKHAQNWSLVAEFCAHDGLQVLCDLLQPHADAQTRAQAVDAFVQITSNAAFDWFDAPVGHQAKLLHAKMLALAAPGAGLLPRLIENADAYGRQRAEPVGTQEIAAGATLVLLQVLAFFLSWLRKLHARDHELRLSRALLELLRDWSTRTRTSLEEETELASRVYEDFSRWPPLEDALDRVDADASVDATVDVDVDVDVDVRTSASSSVFSRAAVVSLIADDAATDEALEQSIATCSDAITAGVAVVDAQLSRAQLRFKRTRRRTSSASPDDDDVHAALADCSAVLAVDPTNVDAWRCRLGLYSACGLWDEALAAVDALLNDPKGQPSSLLPDDIRALEHEREELERRAQQAEAQDAARRRVLAARDAKMEAIAQRLLQRNTSASASAFLSAPRALETSPPTDKSHEPSFLKDTKAPDPLARFRAPPRRKTPTSAAASTPESVVVESVVQTRTFVRRCLRRRTNRRELEELLLELTPPRDVLAALESSLPDDLVLRVLEVLVAARPSRPHSVRQRRELLQKLLALPRLALLRDMADTDAQRHWDAVIATGESKILRDDLGTEWAPQTNRETTAA